MQKIFLDRKLSNLSKGRHHWPEDKWFKRLGEFFSKVLGINGLSKKDMAAAILMQYPAFGPSTGKKNEIIKKNHYKKTQIYKLLGYRGIYIFKTQITENNNEDSRDAFFKSKIVQVMWQAVLPYMTEEECFPNGPNENIMPTYKEITRIMRERYHLEMPAWW